MRGHHLVRPATDSGSVTPLMTGVLVVASLCVLGVGEVSHQLVRQQRAVNAAEALATAVAAERDTAFVLIHHGISHHIVEHQGSVVTVRIERDGVSARATATVHRRTLDNDS
ncbi:MAG: pilus assembly protein TadG-related protein [Ilumatobacteraceae bacterium]